MPTLIKDVRSVARTLVTKLGFTLVAVLAIGLTIGANTAIFNAVHANLRRDFALCSPASLATVGERSPDRNTISPANYPDSKGRNRVFGDLAAVVDIFPLQLTGSGQPEELLPAGAVSANFFQMIGVQPVIGRAFLPAEGTRGRDHVVILSHQVWRRRFGGNVGILRQSITLSGEIYQVIGILPADFSWNNRRMDVWIPYAFDPERDYRSIGDRAI